MSNELWLLSVVFGLAVSAALHLIFIWPTQEPDELDDAPAQPSGDVSSER